MMDTTTLAPEAWPDNVPPRVRRSVERIAGALDRGGLRPSVSLMCRARRPLLEVLASAAGKFVQPDDEWAESEIEISTNPALPAGQYVLVCVRPDGSAYDASEPDAPDFLRGQTLSSVIAHGPDVDPASSAY